MGLNNYRDYRAMYIRQLSFLWLLTQLKALLALPIDSAIGSGRDQKKLWGSEVLGLGVSGISDSVKSQA